MKKNLTVLLLFDDNEEQRVKLRRFFYEVQANVFVGTASASVRNGVWKAITQEGVGASIIFQSNNQQGFSFKTTVENRRPEIERFANTLFIESKKPVENSAPKELQLNELLAKMNPSVLLIDHMLEVGCVAEALMRHGRMYNMVRAVAKKTNLDFDKLVDSISFLCAVHDIGKAHPKFVEKMYSNATEVDVIELYTSLIARRIITDEVVEHFRHERFSRDILKKYFYKNGFSYEAEKFADILAYHHQGKDGTDFVEKITLEDTQWLKLHDELLDKVSKIWTFDNSLCECERYINGLTYCILSIMVVSDWIASGSEWRELVDFNPERSLSETASKFIQEHELAYIPMSKRLSGVKWNKAFGFSKNEMQKKVIEMSKDNPQLMIIEYPCGGGKTEAALAAATILGREKSGIFIATPTMATAKGMVARMNGVAKNIGLNINIPEIDSSILWSDQDMFKVPAYLWTSKTRHRMLYPFAVGTVDQVLKTILHYRYSCIGMSGLSDKVIIIDEIHAYDSYMLTELKRLIKWCSFLDIPLILLSATLPTVTKMQLLKEAGCKEVPSNNDYPLITAFKKHSALKTVPVECDGCELKFNIIYTSSPDCADTFFHELQNDYDGCTAFIERTVDDTWELFRKSRAIGMDSVIFHGRDTIEHKEKKTLSLIKKLGKDRSARPEKMALIATPIIEQSLDIDLDRMVTSIAPIDLLIQRFGRVWRHDNKGTIRETEDIEYPITIIIPDTFARLTHIYDTEILRRTVEILEGRTVIDTVKDARMLIDTVYDSDDTVDHYASMMRAGYKLINMPAGDESTILANSNIAYEKFESNEVSTREENYPTVSIAVLDKKILDNIDYPKIKKIMQQNVVSISEYRCQDIHAEALQMPEGLLKSILIFDEAELKEQGIELTEDGLKFSNN